VCQNAVGDRQGEHVAINEQQTDDDLVFNPFDPSQTHTSWEKLARLRRELPLSRPLEGFVYTAKYEDTRETFRDSQRFFYGDAGMRKPGAVVDYEERMLGEIDPPEHPGIRRMLHRYFTPAAAVAEEPFTRQYVREKLEAVAAKGRGEMVADFSIVVPIAVTAQVIGLATDHIAQIAAEALDIRQYEEFLQGTAGVEKAFPKLSALCDAAIDQRLASLEPPDDVVSTMLFTEDDRGQRMSRRQVRTLLVNLLTGSSSTTSLFDNLFYRILSDRSFDAALRADRSLIPKAVEESLRLEPPVLFLFREARLDTELSGHPVHKGERICMGIASANRDEECFARSEEFRLDRQGEPEHVSFGWGPHLCLGIHLARMEARIAVEELFDLFPPGGISLPPGFVYEFQADDFLRFAPAHLEVVVDATSR
jgi:cytochrome P450